MIPVYIPNDSSIPDNMSRLSLYVAAAPGHRKKNDGQNQNKDSMNDLAGYIADSVNEKLDKLWIANCPGFTELEDLTDALINIEAVRTQRPDIKSKTFHYIVSFHPGEENDLSEDDLKDIEANFAKDLGYEEHQRVIGTHKNTQNYHMHVAINMIHPLSYKRYEPSFFKMKLLQTARKMEKKYGLYVDHGIEKKNEQLSSKAKEYEAKTWQQSFEGYVREHAEGIFSTTKEAKSWQDLHEGLKQFDLGIKPLGAGLTIHELKGKRSVKASMLGRQFSMKNLTERFGPYVPPLEHLKEKTNTQFPKFSYQAKPLTMHPGQKHLWRMYAQGKRPPGFLNRNFALKNWKYYLMADAHRDPMAMATIIFYREILHMIDTSLLGSARQSPAKIPTDLKPALHFWFNKQDWLPSGETPLERPGQISGIGLRINNDDRILFPMRDNKGVVWSVRAMDDKGQITDIGDVSVRKTLHHTLDRKKLLTGKDGPYNGPIILATDCANAVTLHKHTSAPVILAANAENLKILAKETRTNHQSSPIWIMAHTDNEHAIHAAEAVNGRHINTKTMMAIASDLSDQVKAATPSPLDKKKLLQNQKSYEGSILLTSLRDTGAEFHKITGVPVVAVDLDKNLPKIAKDLRAKHPDSEIIILADNEVVPAQKAAKAVKGKHMTGEQLVKHTALLKAKRFQQKAKAQTEISR